MTLPAVSRVALWLGCLSCVAIVVAHLALTDIYHQEADLALEWLVLRVAFAVIVAFHVASFVALKRSRG
jgi:hypothetical protein